MTLLGKALTSVGVAPDPKKLKVISELTAPRNVTGVRSVLGQICYYRSFVPNFAIVAAPMFELLRENKVFQWTAKCQEAFEKLRDSLLHSHRLKHPNVQLPFRLTGDASNYGLGCILSQINPDTWEDDPILSVAESNYDTTECETLCTLWALRKFWECR